MSFKALFIYLVEKYIRSANCVLSTGEKVENKQVPHLVDLIVESNNKGTNRYLIMHCDITETSGAWGHDRMIRKDLWEVTSEWKPEGWKKAVT